MATQGKNFSFRFRFPSYYYYLSNDNASTFVLQLKFVNIMIYNLRYYTKKILSFEKIGLPGLYKKTVCKSLQMFS